MFTAAHGTNSGSLVELTWFSFTEAFSVIVNFWHVSFRLISIAYFTTSLTNNNNNIIKYAGTNDWGEEEEGMSLYIQIWSCATVGFDIWNARVAVAVVHRDFLKQMDMTSFLVSELILYF